MPANSAIRSCPSASAISPAAMNIAALAKACETACSTPPVQATPLQEWAETGAEASGNIKNR